MYIEGSSLLDSFRGLRSAGVSLEEPDDDDDDNGRDS
jgi:hypothetical protein